MPADARSQGRAASQTGQSVTLVRELYIGDWSHMHREGLIERLDSRLGRIEDQLKDSSRQGTPEKITVESHPTHLYEGASSFTNQSAQATEVAQLTAFSQGEGSLHASFDDLKSLLQPSTTLKDFQFAQSNALRELPEMNLIPSAIVADIVRTFRGAFLIEGELTNIQFAYHTL